MNDINYIVNSLIARKEVLEKENDVLRGIVAAANIPCVYCDLEDMSKCKHGFPGCSQADDLLCGQDVAWKAIIEERNELRRQIRAQEITIEKLKDEAIHNEGVMVSLKEGYLKLRNDALELKNKNR
jgi:hypothetical protein